MKNRTSGDRRQTIVIIEDNRIIRENLAEILTLENYHVLEAENGRTGIETIVSNNPDLILCDVIMPDINGFDVFNKVKDYITAHRIPFVFLTAQLEIQDKCKGLDMGAEDYITKPFDGMELLSVIRSRISKREMLRESINSQKLHYLKDLQKMSVTLSHGVRSPLCSCLGLAQLLERSDVKSMNEDDLLKIVSGIVESANKLEDITSLLSEQLHQSEIKHKSA